MVGRLDPRCLEVTEGPWRGPKRSGSAAGKSLELNLEWHLQPGYHSPWWTPEELALLETGTDVEVAARIGRSANGVRIKRWRIQAVTP